MPEQVFLIYDPYGVEIQQVDALHLLPGNHVFEQSFQIMEKPLPHGDSEYLLPLGQDSGGQEIPKCAFQDMLPFCSKMQSLWWASTNL